MKKTKKRALYVFAALLATLFVAACLAGFAACGGGSSDDCADGHTWDAGVVTRQADCGNAGETTYTCTVCGETKTEALPAATGEHTYVLDETKTVDATCTEDGTTYYVCSVCGDTSKASEAVDALGHDYVQSSDSVAATELQNGKTVMVCSRCGDTTTEVVKATGTWNTFEAEDGLLDAGTSTKFGTEKHDSTTSGSPASGGMNVKDFEDGSYVAFRINASKAVTGTTLTVIGASNNNSISTTDLDMSNANVTLNGEAVALSGTFPGGGYFNYSNWSDAATATINLVDGENIFVFSGMTKTLQYNFDAIQIVSPAGVTLTDTTKGVYDSENQTYTTAPLTTCVTSGHELVGTYTAGSGDDGGSWSYTCEFCGETVDLDSNTDWRPVKSVTLNATDATTFEAALDEGGDIELAADITATTTVFEVSEDTEIDLAGHSISTGTFSSAVNTIEVAEGATLTIADSSTGGTGAIKNTYKSGNGESSTSTDNAAAISVAEGGTLVIESGTIESSSVGVRAEGVSSDSTDRASVTIDGGEISSTYFTIWASGDADVTISGGTISGTDKGICIGGDSNFGYDAYQYSTKTTLTITGGEISCTNDSAICTLGVGSADSAEITISGGTISNSATVTGTGSSITAPPAIYVPSGTLTITGGTIISTLTAVEIRGGTATISGGTLVTTYSDEAGDDATQSTFGAKTYGYALSVYAYGVNSSINKRLTDSNDNYTNDVKVTVTGGTFVGDIYVAAEAEYDVTSQGKWQVSLNDDNVAEGAHYVVKMTGIELVGYTSNNQPASTGDTVAYYLWEYEDLTSNFVTGGYNSSDTSIPEEAYKYTNPDDSTLTATFTGSSITVERVGTTYIVSGTSAVMSDVENNKQLSAFWGDGATDHTGDEYITILITAGATDKYTIISSKSPEGIEMGGGWVTEGDVATSDYNEGWTLIFDVTGAEEGAWLFTIVDSNGVEFDVVLGTITSSTTDNT